jgi:hypothetical protein
VTRERKEILSGKGRDYLLSGFEANFSAASKSIGPTKNALPIKYRPMPIQTALSLLVSKPVFTNIHNPPKRQNANDRHAPIRAIIFMVFELSHKIQAHAREIGV